MKSDNPKISVIVPVYNAEKHLRRCIGLLGTICDEYVKQDSGVCVFYKENRG